MAGRREDVTMEGVRILFRNFSGKEGQFNVKGQRNFCVVLNDDVAEQMLADGWNVKYLKPREEGDEATPYLKVKVNMDSEWPPRVVLVTSRGRTDLGADDLPILDWSELTNVDLVINPNRWGPMSDGKEGITAYLRSGYFTIYEDALDLKYSALPDAEDSAQTSVKSNGVAFS